LGSSIFAAFAILRLRISVWSAGNTFARLTAAPGNVDTNRIIASSWTRGTILAVPALGLAESSAIRPCLKRNLLPMRKSAIAMQVRCEGK